MYKMYRANTGKIVPLCNLCKIYIFDQMLFIWLNKLQQQDTRSSCVCFNYLRIVSCSVSCVFISDVDQYNFDTDPDPTCSLWKKSDFFFVNFPPKIPEILVKSRFLMRILIQEAKWYGPGSTNLVFRISRKTLPPLKWVRLAGTISSSWAPV